MAPLPPQRETLFGKSTSPTAAVITDGLGECSYVLITKAFSAGVVQRRRRGLRRLSPKAQYHSLSDPKEPLQSLDCVEHSFLPH